MDSDETVTTSEISKKYNNAINHLGSVASKLPKVTLLMLYGRYKQVSEGQCNTSKPSFLNTKARQKWEAWNKLGTMTETEAMREYIDILEKADPSWSADSTNSTGWARVSRMPAPQKLQNSLNLSDSEAFLEAVKDGNIETLQHIEISEFCDVKFNDGMTALHWAVDRGHTKVVELLISNSFGVNVQDEQGLTPLHYAATVGHSQIITLLLSHKADPLIKDFEGSTAVDEAESDAVKDLFKIK